MKKADTTFLVDTVLDPNGKAKVMRGLRAVARLGRLAEKALERLESDGSFPDRAPWLARSKYGRSYQLKYSRFPTIPVLSREDVPWYGPLSLKTGSVWKKEYGGFMVDCVDVLVRAGVRRGETWEPADMKIGYVKLNVSVSTFFPVLPPVINSDGVKIEQKQPLSIPLLKGQPHWSVKAAAECVAENVAGSKEATPFQAMLYASLTRWLVEDGHAESLLGEVRKYAISHKVVRRVLSD
jgi:hypothetical protein